SLVLEHAARAAERAADTWRMSPSGRTLLESASDDLSRASSDLSSRAERIVRAWQQSVFETVRSAGSSRRNTQRSLAVGMHGLGVCLMIEVVAPAGHLLDAERADATDEGLGTGSRSFGRSL